ncbi:MAG: spermidine/putrescine transport system substrate-binding protein [Gaiellales bacterium]|jgi:spermidine/putrescine transport system substrate-binding protein|nr:spermidine/putrescine transport system substrate-binding protein [Gaiellales bacterium]
MPAVAERSTRRDFLLSTSVLLAGTACMGRGGSSGVETFGPGFIGSPDQAPEDTLQIVASTSVLSQTGVDRFAHRTGVRVTVKDAGSDDELLLRLAAGGYGEMDLVVLGADAVDYLVQSKQVEPLARSLVPGRTELQPPFSDPPYDSGANHSVPVTYRIVGMAVADGAPLEEETWAETFRLAEVRPGSVAIPNARDDVIGAVLVSLGHAWDTDSNSELDEAAGRLHELRPVLRFLGSRLHGESPVAAGLPLVTLTRSQPYLRNTSGRRFVVPREGSAVDVRSYVIPAFAPHPVAAHAWLASWLDPHVQASAAFDLGIPLPLESTRPLLPSAHLENEAVCPPLAPLRRSVQPNISENGRTLRDEIWAGLGA